MRLPGMLLALLALLTAIPAYCEGKITVDPNVPGAQVEATVPESDTHLDQKITYEARRKCVSQILDDLTESTGITFRAGYNSQDWQVRDRKMNIFAKDLPLRELMNSIARVMKFKWSRSEKDGVYSYRLYMDRKTLLGAEAQRARSEARALERTAKRREKLIEDFGNAGLLTEKDLARLKVENPWSYLMASSGIGVCIGRLCREMPGMVDVLATGQELTLSVSQLTPAAQEAVRGLMRDLNGFSARSGGSGGIDVSGDIGEAILWINQNLDRVPSFPVLGVFGLRYGDYCDCEVPLYDPDSKLAPLLGKLFVDAEEGKGSVNQLAEAVRPQLSEAAASDRGAFDPGEPLVEHPNDPTLLTKIKLQPKSNLLQDVQCALADASQLGVVSDSFGQAKLPRSIGEEEAEIRALLEEVAAACYYNWDSHGSIIEFRDRYWFKNRSAQIPESWLEAWRRAFKETGTLDLPQLAQIAELSLEQVNVNLGSDDILCGKGRPSLITVLVQHWDLLRAYAALTNDERQALFSSSGLDLSAVPPDRRMLVEKPIARHNPAFLENYDAQIRLSVKKVAKGKQFDYTFTITTSGELEPIVWTFTTPEYEPPTKGEPKEKPKSAPED